jgi:hypothetical protein
VPDELDDRRRLRLDVLADVSHEHLVGPPAALAPAKESALLQVEAVVALDVAHRPDGLGQDVEAVRDIDRT